MDNDGGTNEYYADGYGEADYGDMGGEDAALEPAALALPGKEPDQAAAGPKAPEAGAGEAPQDTAAGAATLPAAATPHSAAQQLQV
jgi:hypothetical protein